MFEIVRPVGHDWLMESPPHGSPDDAQRKEATARMVRVLDKAAANLRDVPDSEFQSLDEAMDCVLRRER